ncbi:MAG: hypothetical protein ABSC62_10660 [Terracidiphilus sp.]|jgi:hypothetical protein
MSDASQAHRKECLSETAQKAIGEQLERLLASPYLSHSKRFPNFLSFVVEHTLAGEVDDIKERTLGIEIFGKDASYDTALDPIVRVTAAEIRKRLAQYYQDSAHDEELRITLPSGSYIPQFHSPKGRSIHGLPEIAAVPAGTPEHVPAPATQARRWWLLAAVGVAAAGLLVWGTVVFWQRANRAAVDFFWQPVLSSNGPVLLCVPEQPNGFAPNVLNPGNLPYYQVAPTNAKTPPGIDDLSAGIKVAGILQSSGKQYALKGEGATALDDLQRGPTVFVGAYDNAWTLRLTNPLHYHFANDADMMHQWIVDSTAPDKTRWMIDRGAQMASDNYRDYAIVARFTDPNTGKLAVILAGIGPGGTRAAAEYITDSAYLTQLMRAAQAAGDKKNMEFVISTQIIDGEPGTPRVEASYFW